MTDRTKTCRTAAFAPDYRHVLDAVRNRPPRRLPIYEHLIDTAFMEKLLGRQFAPLLDGIDTDLLVRLRGDEIHGLVLERGEKFRRLAKGFSLGSGNSIPKYVPVENYPAMIRASAELRGVAGPEE